MKQPSVTPFIEFKEIRKSFERQRVLDGLTLEIRKGETLTILGGSGSGKTVCLKVFLGLLHPDGGSVLFDGRNVITMKEEDLLILRRRVGMLFQGGALFDSLSVKENVAYPLREHFHYDEEAIARIVGEKLGLVGLEGTEGLFPAELSGGMKKRVALARAIATEPEVILYDEPTTGLDPKNTRRIERLIRDVQQKLKVTSIVVTHDIEFAALLHRGKIEIVGSKEEIQRSPNPVVKGFISGDVREA